MESLFSAASNSSLVVAPGVMVGVLEESETVGVSEEPEDAVDTVGVS